MIHYLRNSKNKTIVEIMCWVKHDVEFDHDYIEVSASVSIPDYSIELLNRSKELTRSKLAAFISAIDDLDEIRGWFYEVYLSGRKNTPDLITDVNENIRDQIKAIADEFGMMYVED